MRKRAALVPLLLALVLAQATALSAGSTEKKAPLHVYARTIEIDDRAGTALYRGQVSMTDGALTLKADRVEATMRDGELEVFTAVGKPVEIEHRSPDTGEVLRARSTRVVYHAMSEILDMYGDVRLFQDGSELRCAQLHYELQTHRLLAQGGENGGRCYVLVQPKDKNAGTAKK